MVGLWLDLAQMIRAGDPRMQVAIFSTDDPVLVAIL